MKRTIIRVQWRKSERGWAVKEASSGKILAIPLTQAAAVKRAVYEARVRLLDGLLSQVMLHGKDGRIRWERTYGRDPRRSPG